MKLFFKSGKLTLPQQVLKNKNDIEILKDKAFIVNPTGAYVEDKIYKKYDMVAYQENAYIYINDVESQGIAPTNADYWALYSSAQTGEQGPQGATGPQGPQGANGIGFNNATNINVINDAITVDNTGISLEQTTEVITQSNGTFEINTQSKLPIVGSESVVVDVAEDGEHAEIHLDADITNKLARTLVTPTSTPTATELVAVDNTNSQTMLSIGEGLSVENGTLKASGGTGGSKLYKHRIQFVLSGGGVVYVYLLSYANNVFTKNTIADYITSNLPAQSTNSGTYLDRNETVYEIEPPNSESIYIKKRKIEATIDENSNITCVFSYPSVRVNYTSLSDIVTEII